MRLPVFLCLFALLWSGPSVHSEAAKEPGIAPPTAVEGAEPEPANQVGNGDASCKPVHHETAPSVPLRHQIGQILMAGFEGRSPRSRRFRDFVRFAEDSQLGGVLFLTKNISSRSRIREMIETLRSKIEVPPFIAIDQEGGRIQRLTGAVGFRNTPSARKVGATLTPPEAYDLYSRLAAGLADWGFDMNIGPVVDLDTNPKNPIIGKLQRSYSADPDIVTSYARAFVEAHGSIGIAAVLKHFPGHGSAWVDSHVASVDVSATWSSKELDPYRALSTSDAPFAIMTGHLTLNRQPDAAFGPQPASLSAPMIQRLIRTELCFQGVVITDDVRMDALADAGSIEAIVMKAIRAGNDLIIVSSKDYDDPRFFDRLLAAIEKRAEDDPALKARIGEAYARVRALKKQLWTKSRPATR